MDVKKIVRTIAIVICVIVAALGFYLYKSMQPVPEKDRTIAATTESGDKVKMQMSLKSVNDSTAITRTYLAKNYEDFSREKQNKAKQYVCGNIEGDMPSIEMKKGEVFRPHFFIGETDVTPSEPPKIKAEIDVDSVKPNITEKGDAYKVIHYEGQLKSDEDGYYFDFADLASADKLASINSVIITLEYQLKGENYVSLTAVNLTTLK